MDAVLKNKFGLFKDENDNFRPMFSVNIEILDKSRLPIASVDPEDFKSKPLHENFEPGSVIIVDEASEIYPVRAAASRLPAHVEGLNTLRHHGLTLFIITQAPTMIDIFVRNLVGKHWHIDRKQLGSKFYEWNKCIVSPGKSYFAEAYSELYKPNKEVFGLYQSATKHIKFKKSVSWHYKAVPILILVVALSLYFGFSGLNKMAGEDKQQLANYHNDINHAPAPTNTFDKASVVTGVSVNDYKPRVAGKEETAPLYDGVRQVADFPKISGCVKTYVSKDSFRCTCYSQQGSPLAEISLKDCINYFVQRPFNPYLPPSRDSERANPDSAPRDSPLLSAAS